MSSIARCSSALPAINDEPRGCCVADWFSRIVW